MGDTIRPFPAKLILYYMINFSGEHLCRLDDKGRLKIPSAMLKQLPEEDKGSFYINRGFERCLILYPKSGWLNIVAEINKLNSFQEKTRKFKRHFYRGSTELIIDSSDRILLPKQLLVWANLEKDITILGLSNYIEIWDTKAINEFFDEDSSEYSDLGEQVMGKANNDTKGN